MTVLRRAITLSGVKPVGAYQHRFIYRYCFGVVEPLQGDHVFVTAPQANTFFFEFLLHEFAQHEPEVYKIIFLDRAGYHLTKALQIPDNIHLLYLPSSNPDRTADAAKPYRAILARDEKTGGFQKLLR